MIIGLEDDSERDDWDEGTGWMGSLMSLRPDLLRGDLRCLYLGWLHCVQCDEFDQKDLELPVPPGLRELSASLHSLIDFLAIDEDLIEVAARQCRSRTDEVQYDIRTPRRRSQFSSSYIAIRKDAD